MTRTKINTCLWGRPNEVDEGTFFVEEENGYGVVNREDNNNDDDEKSYYQDDMDDDEVEQAKLDWIVTDDTDDEYRDGDIDYKNKRQIANLMHMIWSEVSCDIFRYVLDNAMTTLGENCNLNLLSSLLGLISEEYDELHDNNDHSLLEFCLMKESNNFTDYIDGQRFPYLRILIENGLSVDEVDLTSCYYSGNSDNNTTVTSLLGHILSQDHTTLSTVKYLVEILDININMNIINNSIDYYDKSTVTSLVPYTIEYDRIYRMYSSNSEFHNNIILPYIATSGVTQPYLYSSHSILQYKNQLTNQFMKTTNKKILQYLLNDANLYDIDYGERVILCTDAIWFITGTSIGWSIPSNRLLCLLFTLPLDDDNNYITKEYIIHHNGHIYINDLSNCCKLLFFKEYHNIRPMEILTIKQCQILMEILYLQRDRQFWKTSLSYDMIQYLFDEVGLVPNLACFVSAPLNNQLYNRYDGDEMMRSIALKYCYDVNYDIILIRLRYFIEKYNTIINNKLIQNIIQMKYKLPIYCNNDIETCAIKVIDIVKYLLQYIPIDQIDNEIIVNLPKGLFVMDDDREIVLYGLIRWHRLTKHALESLLLDRLVFDNGRYRLGYNPLDKNKQQKTLLMNLHSWQYQLLLGNLQPGDDKLIDRLRYIHHCVDELVRYLVLDIGIDINAQDKNGKTAMIYTWRSSDQMNRLYKQYMNHVYIPLDYNYDNEIICDKNQWLQLIVLRVLYKYGGDVMLGTKDPVELNVLCKYQQWMKKMFVGQYATVACPLPYGGTEEEWIEQDNRFFETCCEIVWEVYPLHKDESFLLPLPVWNRSFTTGDDEIPETIVMSENNERKRKLDEC